MRLVVQRHALEPHEAAVPQALTGRPVGQPAAAGLGTHVQRWAVERASAERKAPFSYVFATGGLSGDNVSAAASAGVHPGVARPLMVKVDNAARLVELLGRPTVGDGRAKYDELMNVYIEQHERRLRTFITRLLADASAAGFTLDDILDGLQAHRKGDA